MVARRAHNPKVVGSNPAPATSFQGVVFIRIPLAKAMKGYFRGSLLNLTARLDTYSQQKAPL
jgi:hypothetical protein